MAPPLSVSHADRLVFPDVGRTKGDLVDYYERIAVRALPHLALRPLSIKRFPRGLSGPGFFQKNVAPHYPESIERFPIPRSREASRKHAPKTGKSASGPAEDVTVYPIIDRAEHLAYLANQNALELHVPLAQKQALTHPDRVVIDLDPPLGATALVRRSAHLVRDALERFGLRSVPLATGSKGYHLVATIEPRVHAEVLASTLQKFSALLTAAHPDQLTSAFRIALRGERVFIDWLRNRPNATVIAPYSLRARARASVAVPLTWDELDTTLPDAFTIADVVELLERPDPLALLAAQPNDPAPFVTAVEAAFESAGLVLEPFDRFRS